MDAYIAEVRPYNKWLLVNEVRERYLATCERYDACSESDVGTAAACMAPQQVDDVVFAVDAACQEWAVGGSGAVASSTRWGTSAGDPQLGISTEGLQYDAKEGRGSYLFDGVVQSVDLDISPSQLPTLAIELWIRVNSFAGTSNG